MAPPILEFLSFRTFSNVWYWIAVAVLWANISHRPMGIPYDMVWRARIDARHRAQLDDVARIMAHRLVEGARASGTVVAATGSAVLSMLVLLAVLYDVEVAQGALLIVLPCLVLGWFNLRTATTIDAGGDPARHLRRLRGATNAIGLVSLFLTAVWGMYVNMLGRVL